MVVAPGRSAGSMVSPFSWTRACGLPNMPMKLTVALGARSLSAGVRHTGRSGIPPLTLYMPHIYILVWRGSPNS